MSDNRMFGGFRHGAIGLGDSGASHFAAKAVAYAALSEYRRVSCEGGDIAGVPAAPTSQPQPPSAGALK